MTMQEVKQDWIKEINRNFSKHGIEVKDSSIMNVYDASKERGLSKELWLVGECTDGQTRYFYMDVTKKNVLKKYYGTVYSNTKSTYDMLVANYPLLGKVE